jgi:hypothetical protein
MAAPAGSCAVGCMRRSRRGMRLGLRFRAGRLPGRFRAVPGAVGRAGPFAAALLMGARPLAGWSHINEGNGDGRKHASRWPGRG